MSYKSQIRKLNLIYKSQLPKAIQARNLAFTALSLQDKKKEIALDALKMVFLEAYLPSRGAYFQYNQRVELSNQRREISSKLLQKEFCDISTKNQCLVCAKGAVLTSRIRLGNSVELKDRYMDEIISTHCTNDDQNVFSSSELNSMENVYERGYMPFRCNTTKSLANILLNILFNGKYLNDSQNYFEICKIKQI